MFNTVNSKFILGFAALVLASGASAQTSSEVYPVQYDRQVLSQPRIDTPPAAVETGLGGIVRVAVIVDSVGNVASVEEALGPGAVCQQIQRADVAALRSAAAEGAKLVKFAPISPGRPELSRSWVRFEFASSGKEAVYVAGQSPVTKSEEGGSAKSMREAATSTVKGDINYSAAASPPDYKGPVNTRDSASSSKPDRFTVLGNSTISNEASPDYTLTGQKLSGGVLNGKAQSLLKPRYPPAARAVRAEGAVTIQVLVDTSGEVFSAHAVSGHPLLRQSAVIAACGSSFQPTFLQDKPVKVSGVITYNFVP